MAERNEMMKNAKFPLPKRYWLNLALAGVLAVLLFANIFATDALTGDKPIQAFTRQDWLSLARFLLAELIVGGLMALCGLRAGRLFRRDRRQIERHCAQFRRAGLQPGACGLLWVSFDGLSRALIARRGDVWSLRIEAFDVNAEEWRVVPGVHFLPTLADVKKTLFFDCNFFCAENAAFDKYGKVEYKDGAP